MKSSFFSLKRMILGAILFVAAVNVHSQTYVIVGAGSQSGTSSNSTTGDPGPVYKSSATSSFNFNRHHYLYTQSELLSSGLSSGDTITSIAWYMDNGAGALWPADIEIWMKNSTLDSVTPVPVSWSTLTAAALNVYDHAYTIPQTTGWVVFNFDSIFVYSGQGIEISVMHEMTGATSPYTTNGYSWKKDPITYRTISYVGSSSSTTLSNLRTVRPQVRFGIPLGNDVALIDLTESVPCGLGPDSLSFTLKNTGANTQSNVPVYMSIDGGSFALVSTITGPMASGSTQTVSMALSSLALGSHSIVLASGLSNDLNSANDTMSTVFYKGNGPISVYVNNGTWGEEMAWALFDATAAEVVDSISGGYYPNSPANTTYTHNACIDTNHSFIFKAYDDFGDGWNGGWYEIYGCNGTQLIANNGGNEPNNNATGDNVTDGVFDLESSESFVFPNCPMNDAGAIALVTPTSPTTQGSSAFSVQIANYGLNTLTSATINYSINGVSQTPFTWTGSLASGDTSGTIAIGSANLNSLTNNILIWTSLPNGQSDEYHANDTIMAAVTACGAFTGTYTVGGSSANFPDFASLLEALSSCGLSGPTTINVLQGSGPFNEQVIFQNISGLSSFNSMVINGNGETIQYDGGSVGSDYRIVGFDGVTHITLNDFTIKELGTSTGFGVHFANSAHYNSVTNCTIDLSNATSLSTSIAGIVASGSFTSATTSTAAFCNHLTIDNNVITGGGGYYPISLYGSSATVKAIGNVVSNNSIDNFYSSGIRMFYQDSMTVSGNNIASLFQTSTTTRYGIYLGSPSNNSVIEGNWIHDLFAAATTYTGTGYGIYTTGFDGTSGNSNAIYNNIISNFEWTGVQYGIYSASSDYLDIVHNTISLDHQVSSTASTYGFYQTTLATGMNFANNLISLTRATSSTASAPVRFNTTTSTIVSDYNVLWIDTNSTTMKTGYFGTTAYSNLAGWQTANSSAYDGNSLQEPPVFAGATNFTPLSLAIDNAAFPVGLTFDYYGNTRSATTPDVGAIEFVGVSGDISLDNAWIARESLCYGTNDSIFFTITNLLGGTVNFGADTLRGSWSITGPVNSNGTFEINSGTLAEGSSLTTYTLGANLSQVGIYLLSINLDTNGWNQGVTNDTLINVSSETVETMLTVTPSTLTITNPYQVYSLVANSPMIAGGTLGTTSAGGNGCGGGAMFDIVPSSAISLVGLTVYPNASNTAMPLNVYVRSGSYLGNEASSTGWTLIETTTINAVAASPSIITLSSPYTMLASQTYGIYIEYSAQYTNGTNSYTDGTVTINVGAGLCSSFGGVNAGRMFNGAIQYVPASAVPGLEWSLGSIVIDSTSSIAIGPFTADSSYTYIATYNVCGNTYIDSSVVTVDLTKAAFVSQTNVDCNGNNTGSATVNASGGDAPYSYLWSDGQTTATATGLVAGTYTVTVRDFNNWPDSSITVTITEPSALSNSMSIVPSGCGAANGSATANVSGGTPGYSYAWSNSTTSATAGSLSSSSYTVTITDANGCTLTDVAAVNDAGAPNINFAITNIISCNGSTDGQITASVSGGATPYSYTWAGSSSTSAIASSIGAGTYTLTVTDSLGCSVNSSTTITQPTTLVASTSLINNVSCNGGSNGSVSTSATGGTASYNYLWSNGSTSTSISGLPASIYTVTVTDAHGCTSTSSKTVTQPTVLTASVSTVSNVSCNGGSNGSLLVISSGGTTGYSYLWSNSQTSATATGLSATNYTVTVTDANLCTTTASGIVTQPTVMVASISGSNDASCFGYNDGEATASGSGGTAGYTYLWSSSATSATATGLAAGTYTVTVTDANGCTDVDNATINEPTLLVSDIIDSSDATCFGYNDGGAEVSASGGTSPYSYDWSGSQTGSIVSTLVAGTHTVTVTDDHGCTSTSEVIIGEPTELMNTFTATNLSCKSSGDGMIESNPTGSVPPYSYNWSNGDVNQIADSLSAGTYSLTITDDHGCMLVVSEVVTEPDTLVSAIDSIVDLLCNGDGNGIVMTSTMGGTMPYDYLWSNSAMTDSIGGLAGGTYTLTVTDTNGCQTTISAVVNEPAVLTSTLAVGDASCFGASDGLIINTIGGGTPTYTSVWSDASTTIDISGLEAGLYSVTVTDANGCTVEANATVNQPDSIDASVTATTVGNGIVLTANATGASYQWIDCSTEAPIDGETNSAFTPTANGSYAVIVTVGDCSDTSDCQEVGNVGIESIYTKNHMKLFPNPTRGAFSIQFNGSYGSDVRFEVLDAQGKLIVNRTMGMITDGQVEAIDTPLSAGVYFVKAYNDDQVMIQRLIVN